MWDFRCNRDHYASPKELVNTLRRFCKKFVFQLEKGVETGYEHWQGRCSLIKKKRKNELMNELRSMDIQIPNYIEPTANTTYYSGDMFYVMKEETRLSEKFYTDRDKEFDEVYMPYQYRGLKEKFYPYQIQVYDSHAHRSARQINFVFDPDGNKGKSTIASIMEIEGLAIDLPPVNDMKELLQVACDECYERTRDPKVVFIDMPRALDKSRLFGIYSGIEQIKKGKLYDCRYHYKKWWIDAPQVWVFSNVPPDLEALSRDRWNLLQINKKFEFEPYLPEPRRRLLIERSENIDRD